jgi:hypothetical protein
MNFFRNLLEEGYRDQNVEKRKKETGNERQKHSADEC